MSLYGLFANGPAAAALQEHLDGNLCRCTGYRPIWDAARALCTDGLSSLQDHAQGPLGPCATPCRQCPERDACSMDCNLQDKSQVTLQDKSHDKSNASTCCTTSTRDKLSHCHSLLLDASDDNTWWNQPDRMFPKELTPFPSPSLLPADSNDHVDDQQQKARHQHVQNLLAKPLVVMDNTVHNGGTWFQPNSLLELLDLIREFHSSDGNNNNTGGIKIVVGNTEVGIETKFKHAVYPRLIHPSESITTLYEIFTTSTHLHIGACSPLATLQHKCSEIMSNPKIETATATSQQRIAKPIHDMLRWFASTQIRNVACLGGNLATASPISDMNPLLASMNASLVLASRVTKDGKASGSIVRRFIPVPEFFVGYRTVQKEPYEVIERVEVPLVQSRFEYVAPFKQARRREDDISIVTSGMRILLSPDGESNSWKIEGISVAFGGMAPKTVMAHATMEFLKGKPFDQETFEQARGVMQNELRMPDDVPGGQPQYRLTLACSFLHKFYLYCVGELAKDVAEAKANGDKEAGDYPSVPVIQSEEESGAGGFVTAPKPIMMGTQRYPAPKVASGLETTHFDKANNDVESSPLQPPSLPSPSSSAVVVGQPATHASGPLHCTGEATYADDIPAPENLLHGSLILASKCHAKVTSIDTSPALQVPGVEGVFTYDDIVKLGGDNRMGPILLDDVAFLPIGETIGYVGQVLGIVVAISQNIAEKGARAVAVNYQDVSEGDKAVVSIEDAIAAKSFWMDFQHEMKRGGNIDEVWKKTEVDGKKLVVVEGEFRCGGQEHFYLEPNSTLAIPSESATNLTIYCSTQAATKTQDFCARVTNTPAAKVVVRMKRMGGGFGGKETRSVFSSVACAVAAKIMNRPVRLTLNRDTDMSITGGRHAFLGRYKAGALVDETEERSAKLHVLDVKIYNNGGSKFDLTGPVLDRALFHIDNCYLWPNFRSVGTPCKTSQPPHTAFRGFGGPQGMSICEHIMDHLAVECSVSPDKLRRENMYTLSDHTPFGMRFGGEFTGKWNVPSMWDRLYSELDVAGRRAEAAAFNAKHKWVKRGVAFIPTKFGIAFTAKFMNQGGALVHLYTDGTVLVSHGGTEMGQGLHTKVCQVAAQAFGIPLDQVYVNDTSTDKVANTIPSAASMSTDLYGMATLDACRKILKRLQPIKDKLPPQSPLKDIAKAAFYERVDLSAHGFFAVDDDRCGYDWFKEKPDGYPAELPENSWKGHPFNYFTQGVALAEVEIDVLTGDHKTRRVDVLVDVGSSINPGIDIGQIEGAFIQGMGWCTIEEVVYADDDHAWIRPRAKVFTTGPGTYKIPSFNDVPEVFNVALLENVDNPFAVHSSKAVGEPPFFLGCTVFFAIKDAVTAARGGPKSGYFEFRMPATSERIRMACADRIASECISGTDSKGALTFQPKGSF